MADLILQQAPSKVIVLDGTAGNGAVGTVAVWALNGRVLVPYLTVHVDADMSAGGAATVKLGTASQTAAIRPSTANFHLALAGYWWTTNSPSAQNDPMGTAWFYQVSESVIMTVSGNNLSGTMRFTAWFYPLAPGASLT